MNLMITGRRKGKAGFRGMKSRILLSVVTAVMVLCPAGAFADSTYSTQGESKDFKSFQRDGVTYYDIYNGQTEGRPVIDDMDKLMRDVIYKCKFETTDGSGEKTVYKTPAEYWAAFANGVFASNPESYYSYDGQSYKTRFTGYPESKKGKKSYYGDLQDALCTEEGGKYYNGGPSSDRQKDILTRTTGIQTASNLNDVQEAAYYALSHMNSGKIKASDFRKFSSLKAMEDDKGDGKVLYNLLTTRDRQGKTFRYIYNCMGIAYSNFTVTPISAPVEGSKSTGVTTALKDYDNLDDAIDDVKSGKSIDGFTASEDDKVTSDSFRNSSTGEQSKTLTLGERKAETLSSTVSHSEQVSFSSTQSANFHFGTDAAFFKAETGFSFTEGKLWENGVSDSNSTEKEESSESSLSLNLPGHTAATQSIVDTTSIETMVYDCPVRISFTVTIFSYNGCYYDDKAQTTYFTSAGYSQSGFMSQFKDAHSNLKSRIAHKGDSGYDRSSGITRGIKVKHGASYQRDCFDWDNPWVDHLDYGAIEKQMGDVGISPGYKDTVDFITTKQPISVTGAELKREGKGHQAFISDILPLYPLGEVSLKNPDDAERTIENGSSFYLRNIKMEASDNKDGDFYGFSNSKGSWSIVDDKGNQIKSSDVISLTKNSNGDYVVKGLAKGTARVKYFVGSKDYRIYSDKSEESKPSTYVYTDPADVSTPEIEITVTGQAAADNSKSKNTKDNAADKKTGTSGSKSGGAKSSGGSGSADDNDSPKITDTDKNQILGTLDCSAGQCSVAQAVLFLKNSMDAESDLSEQIYTRALMQLASDQIDSNDTHAKCEIDAIVWGAKAGLFDEMDRGMLASQSGITEVEFAEIAYKGAVLNGDDVNCDDVIGDYAGADSLDSYEKKAMNWAIGKGLLSDKESSSKKLEPDRILSDSEAAAFFK